MTSGIRIKDIKLKAAPDGLTQIIILSEGDRSVIAQRAFEAKDGKHFVTFEKEKKKRSLTANAYYWVLIEKLSEVLHVPKEEIHKQMLKDYGVFKRKPDGKLICFSLKADIDPDEIPVYTMPVGRGEINGQTFVHLAVLKGSSEMTKEEFSNLLEGVISECKLLDIETLAPDEIRMIYENSYSAQSSS